MKKRLISGIIYIAILVAFFCLKFFVPTVNEVPYGDFCFDVLIYAFALIGTFEMLRALKDKTTKAERAIVWIYAGLSIPTCALFQWWLGTGLQVLGGSVFLLALGLLCLFVAEHKTATLESVGLSLLAAVYPTLMLGQMVLANHMGVGDNATLAKYALDSRIMLLLIFVVSPCADTVAYVFGVCFKKYLPRKMAPELSPNKTVIGGIGGLVGGMIGATALYFLYNWQWGSFDKMYIWLPVYVVVGLVASIATEFGDLVESSIKRKLGVKDMGNIMPGHGGILDRIDGTLFATVVVYFAFVLIRICCGAI